MEKSPTTVREFWGFYGCSSHDTGDLGGLKVNQPLSGSSFNCSDKNCIHDRVEEMKGFHKIHNSGHRVCFRRFVASSDS